jgi:hypothetical protein
MAEALKLAIESGPRAARLQRDAYVALLQHHDWAYQYADDYNHWCAGDRSMKELCILRREVDPDGELWNRFAPPDFQFKPAIPATPKAAL